MHKENLHHGQAGGGDVGGVPKSGQRASLRGVPATTILVHSIPVLPSNHLVVLIVRSSFPAANLQYLELPSGRARKAMGVMLMCTQMQIMTRMGGSGIPGHVSPGDT